MRKFLRVQIICCTASAPFAALLLLLHEPAAPAVSAVGAVWLAFLTVYGLAYRLSPDPRTHWNSAELRSVAKRHAPPAEWFNGDTERPF